MTTALADFEGVTLTMRCAKECGEQICVRVDTTDIAVGARLINDPHVDRALWHFAQLLGWNVKEGGSSTANIYTCPACKYARAAAERRNEEHATEEKDGREEDQQSHRNGARALDGRSA